MRRSGRSKRGKGKGAAQAAGGFPTTARLLGPSAPKCPKAEIPMGRMSPVPDNRRFPRETPAAISSRRQGGLFGFDSMPRNHAEKGNQLGSHLRIRSPPYPRGRPETEPKRHASAAIRQGAGNCPAPIAFYVGILSSVSAFPCIDTLQFVVASPCIGMLWLIVALPRTGASSHIGTSPAPPSGYTPMVPIRSSSDAVSIHQTPELSCVNVSSTWRSAASASRVTSRKIWPPCL